MSLRPVLAAVVLMAVTCSVDAGQEARFDTALDLARAGQGAAAVAMFRQLASAGDSAAKVNLAVMLVRGTGVPQDEAAAAYWAWRARLAGETRAAALSDHLMTRLTPDARAALAERLLHDLTTQAERGEMQALVGLGRVEMEIRDPARPQEAALWFTLAAAFEVRHAIVLREVALRDLDAAQRLAVQERAVAEFSRWCRALPDAARPQSCTGM
jgi:TPR repeat protein